MLHGCCVQEKVPPVLVRGNGDVLVPVYGRRGSECATGKSCWWFVLGAHGVDSLPTGLRRALSRSALPGLIASGEGGVAADPIFADEEDDEPDGSAEKQKRRKEDGDADAAREDGALAADGG